MNSDENHQLKHELKEALQLIENLGTRLTGLTSVVRVIALTHPNRADLLKALEEAKIRLEGVYGETQLSDQIIQNTLAPIAEFQQLLKKPPKPLTPFSLPPTS